MKNVPSRTVMLKYTEMLLYEFRHMQVSVCCMQKIISIYMNVKLFSDTAQSSQLFSLYV